MRQIWINGLLQSELPVTDRGFCYGDGLFETIRVDEGEPQLLDQHLARLEQGLTRLKFPSSSLSRVQQYLNRVIFSGDQTLKITVTRGEGKRGYRLPEHAEITVVIMLEGRPESLLQYEQGVSVRLCRYQLSENPHLAGVKHLNRLDQIMARSEWQGDIYAEGLVCDQQGYLAEATMSNLLWVADDGGVFTPSLERCGVEGVMRNHIIQLLGDMGYDVSVGRFYPDVLSQAKEVFLCNSLIEVWPVIRLDEKSYPVGDLTRQIQQAIRSEKNS